MVLQHRDAVKTVIRNSVRPVVGGHGGKHLFRREGIEEDRIDSLLYDSRISEPPDAIALDAVPECVGLCTEPGRVQGGFPYLLEFLVIAFQKTFALAESEICIRMNVPQLKRAGEVVKT